jgi:hypothetical protein
MEISTEPMTTEDLVKINETLERSLRILRKMAAYLLGFAAVMLFVPMEILKFFTRRGGKRDISGVLYQELGLTNTFLFIVLPICVLLILVYFYGAHRIKKDISLKMKDIGVIKVLKIEELDNQMKKALLGTADHIIKFEKNSFDIQETYFLKAAEPELFDAREYVVEVSKVARIELKRELKNG